MEKTNLKIKYLKPGTIKWLKIIVPIGVLILMSYNLEDSFRIFGILEGILLLLFVLPFSPFLGYWAILIIPIYLLLLTNFIYLKSIQKISKWLKCLFWIITTMIIVLWITGVFYFFVYHP